MSFNIKNTRFHTEPQSHRDYTEIFAFTSG